MGHLLVDSQFFNNIIGIIGDKAPDFKDLTHTVVLGLNAFIAPVSIIIGGLSLYKLMALGGKIAHTADRPDERKIAILSLVGGGLGLVLCIAAPLIINLVLPALMNASDHSYVPQ